MDYIKSPAALIDRVKGMQQMRNFRRKPGQQNKTVRRAIPTALHGVPENMSAYEAARVAEEDFLLNGARCRAHSGEFIGPRWVPDLEAKSCYKCGTTFDWARRRHHCRHCGKIMCSKCSAGLLLLPIEFGASDPQRVCLPCGDILEPLQGMLITAIGNHTKSNSLSLGSRQYRRYFNLPYSLTLAYDVRKAAYTIHNWLTSSLIRDSNVSISLLKRARCLLFYTVIKAGCIVTGQYGTGLVIAKLGDGPTARWSAPTAITLYGSSIGLAGGAELADCVMALDQDQAMAAFCSYGQVVLGLGCDAALGPVGRAGSGAAVFGGDASGFCGGYAATRGAFGSLSLEAMLITTRSDVNRRFYGRTVHPAELLLGAVPPPKAALPLYEALTLATQPLFSNVRSYQSI